MYIYIYSPPLLDSSEGILKCMGRAPGNAIGINPLSCMGRAPGNAIHEKEDEGILV